MNLLDWLFGHNGKSTDAPESTGTVEPSVAPVAKPQRSVRYEANEYEVGAIVALVIFSDGREVHTKIYGSVDQYVDSNFFSDRKKSRDEARLSEPWIMTAMMVYQNWINNLDPNAIAKVTDDPSNPTIVWTGIVQHVEIAETLSHKVLFSTAVLVEAHDNSNQR